MSILPNKPQRLALAGVIAVCLPAMAALAQGSVRTPPPAPTAEKSGAGTVQQNNTGATDRRTPRTPRDGQSGQGARTAPPPVTFQPSENISAGKPVSFPSDI